jgi:hypothetical protein
LLFDNGGLMQTMPSTPRAQRDAARRRIGRITRTTAVAAALTTGTVAGLAATTPQATSTTSTVASATDTTTEATLAPSTDAPTVTNDPPLAASGGS